MNVSMVWPKSVISTMDISIIYGYPYARQPCRTRVVVWAAIECHCMVYYICIISCVITVEVFDADRRSTYR